MSNAKKPACTPGPWSVEGPDYFGDWNIHHPSNRLAIGAVVSNGRPPEEVAANAHMLGAAWDMREALNNLMPTNLGALPASMPDSMILPLDVTVGELRKARKALAKARGDL